MNETELNTIAKEIRREVIEMIYSAGSGHPGGSLSITDILVSLYFGGILKFDPKNPKWEKRDYFILSNGHECPSWYAVLAKAGFINHEMLMTLRDFNSPLQGHPEKGRLPFIETTTGSLGQGICVGVGLALGLIRQNKENHVYVLTSDGEHDEGSVWEALRIASHFGLDNLTVIVDKNGMQIDGETEKVSNLNPLLEKYISFGWNAKEINGHNFTDLQNCLSTKTMNGKPTGIIAKTIRGKGISFMENSPMYHAKKLTKEEYQKAMEELK
jgi:transketolase